jgi:hypothetical protein
MQNRINYENYSRNFKSFNKKLLKIYAISARNE